MAFRSSTIAIGTEGQYILQMNLSDSANCEIKLFNNFWLIEEMSNLLPTWQIDFQAIGDIESEWNENKAIPIVLSQSMNDTQKTISNLQIIHPSVSDLGGGVKRYMATGVYYAPAFTQVPFVKSIPECHGTDVLQQVAASYFTVNTEYMTTSTESQVWHQPNTTDKKFLDYVMSHCYVPQSFVYCGITSSGEYIIADPVKLSGQHEKYKLTMSQSDSSDVIQLTSVPQFSSESGMMNSLACYGATTPMIAIDSGVQENYTPSIKYNFVNNSPAQVDGIPVKVNSPLKNSESSDPNSQNGFANFTYGVPLLAMEKCIVAVQGKYFPIKIFDIVNLLNPGQMGLNENYSGRYMVGKVSRNIQNNVLVTYLLLARDAHNRSM